MSLRCLLDEILIHDFVYVYELYHAENINFFSRLNFFFLIKTEIPSNQHPGDILSEQLTKIID